MEKNKVNKNNRLKKTLYIIGKIFGATLIVITIIILIRLLVFNKSDVFGFRLYTILSGSMEPTINISDIVVVKETKNLKEGDIIAFENSGTTIVHRIIEVVESNENYEIYQTKGDANNTKDIYKINSKQVKGKYIFKIPNMGEVVEFLKKHIVIVIIVVFIIIFILLLRLFI